MKHDWENISGRLDEGTAFETVRRCRNCGKRQTKFAEHAWMSVTGYRWEPKVGRCNPTIDQIIERIETDTGGFSILIHIERHPLFKELVAKGSQVIPTILKRLENDPSWVDIMVLNQVVKNPPKLDQKHRGQFDRVVKMWIEWGKQ